MHADRTNRSALTLFGLLLLLAGAAGLVTSVGGFGKTLQKKPLFGNFLTRWIGVHGAWLWPVIAVGCVLLLLLALRWILALLVSGDRAGELTVARDKGQGGTRLRPAALTGALCTEIETYRGVDAAKARIIGDAGDPQLVVRVTIAQTADLTRLRRRIETEALDHARTALDNPNLPVQLDLEVSSHPPDRVS